MCAEQYEVAYRLRVVILHVVACLVSDIDMLFLCLVPHSGRFFWGVLGLEMYYRICHGMYSEFTHGKLHLRTLHTCCFRPRFCI